MLIMYAQYVQHVSRLYKKIIQCYLEMLKGDVLHKMYFGKFKNMNFWI